MLVEAQSWVHTLVLVFQELFGVVGALKKVKLLKAGMAEVVFVRKEDATGSIRKYHMRELDGM